MGSTQINKKNGVRTLQLKEDPVECCVRSRGRRPVILL